MISSVSGVEDAEVRVVVAYLHVLVELLLSVQALVHAFAVEKFDVGATDGAWALGVPILGVAGCSDGWIGGEVLSWWRMLSLCLRTQLVSS